MSGKNANSYAPQPIERDVVIIGAGYGGLMCGAMLAKAGKSVAIVDPSDIIGQPGGGYPYEGYWLDWGNWDAVGMRDPLLTIGSSHDIIAERIGLKQKLIPTGFTLHVEHTGKVMELKLAELLSDAYNVPTEEHHYYFDLVRQMRKEPPERVEQLMEVPFKEWIPQLDIPESVKIAFMKSHAIRALYETEEMSVGRYIRDALQIPFQVFRVDDPEVGGAQGYVEPVARIFREAGGEIHLDHKAIRILTAGGKVTGMIALDSHAFIREFRTSTVIFTEPAYVVFDLIDDFDFPDDFVKKAWITKDREVPSIHVQIALSEMPTRRDGGVEDRDGWHRRLAGPELDYGGGWIFPSLTSRLQSPEGKHMLTLYFAGPGTYAEMKGKMDAMVAYVHDYYPNLADVTEWAKYQWFNGPCVANWTLRIGERAPSKTPLEGLYLQGYTTEVCGSYHEAEDRSALEVVDAILDERTRQSRLA